MTRSKSTGRPSRDAQATDAPHSLLPPACTTLKDLATTIEACQTDLLAKFEAVLGIQTTRQLADILGVSPQAVDNARRLGKIPDRWIMFLADYCGLPIRMLLQLPLTAVANLCDSLNRPQFIPVLQGNATSDPPTLDPQGLRDYIVRETRTAIALPISILPPQTSPSDLLVGHRVITDSMEPTLPVGSVCIINLSKRQLIAGAIYALYYEGGYTGCRISGPSGGRVRFVYDNPKAPDVELDRSAITLLGRVIYVCRAV